MNETFPEPNQERNLSLERQESVKKHNDLLKEYENMSDEDKNWNQETNTTNDPEAGKKNTEMFDLRKKVGNIDEYKKFAISKENLASPIIGDISDTEKIKTEKVKINNEIEKVKKDIDNTTNKLNELRSKLGMPPSEDIPSLHDKKENLGNLLLIQKDLENKLNFEIKKQEASKSEGLEQNNLEQRFLKNSLNELSSSLRRMVSNQDSFSFNIIASGLEDLSDIDDLKSKLSKIVISAEDFAKNGLKDNLDDLHQNASRLSQIEAKLRDLPSIIKDEGKRKEFGQFVSGVAGKVAEVVAFIKLKASRLQDYHNVR